MTGSAENGSEQELSLSRTSKLVMAAASLTPKYKIQPGTATKNRSPVVKKQNKITVSFQVEKNEQIIRVLSKKKRSKTQGYASLWYID